MSELAAVLARVPVSVRWLMGAAFVSASASLIIGAISSLRWWEWTLNGCTLALLPVTALLWSVGR